MGPRLVSEGALEAALDTRFSVRSSKPVAAGCNTRSGIRPWRGRGEKLPGPSRLSLRASCDGIVSQEREADRNQTPDRESPPNWHRRQGKAAKQRACGCWALSVRQLYQQVLAGVACPLPCRSTNLRAQPRPPSIGNPRASVDTSSSLRTHGGDTRSPRLLQPASGTTEL